MPFLNVDPGMLVESPMEERSQDIIDQEDALKSSLDHPDCSYSNGPLDSRHRQERRSVQRDDALFKAAWSKEMEDVAKGFIYRTVSAVLISWDGEAGDLETGEEAQKKYQFDVTDARLSTAKAAQHQINRHLATFVDEKHDEDGLLIVYYAGHGIPGNLPGDLTLAGSRNPEHHDSERKKKFNEIIWHRAENLIRDSLGDVLVIFDCCAAGNLGRDMGARGRWAHRAFEFLGATSAEDTTPEPGPNSFTSALIWALEKLAAEEGFTASELLRKITCAPNFPKNQVPVQCDRDKPSLRKIVISPLLEHGNQQREAAAKKLSVSAECPEFLDLRVSLSHHPTEDDITSIAQTLKGLITTKSLPAVQQIAWGKFSVIEGTMPQFPALARSVSFAQRWRRMTKHKIPSQNGLDAKEDFNSNDSSQNLVAVSECDPKSSRKLHLSINSCYKGIIGLCLLSILISISRKSSRG